MDAVTRVRELVESLVEQQGAELYDIEHSSGILRIMVDKPGGIDVDTIGELSHEISIRLDEEDPIPESRYLLEVTSPGVERKLRLPDHFAKQIGESIAIKVKRTVVGERRFDGVLNAVDEIGIELRVGDQLRSLAYTDIDSARLIYDWSKDFAPTHNYPLAKGDENPLAKGDENYPAEKATAKPSSAGHNNRISKKKASAR